ncbi:MAG TPA: 4'-phosphopantetheinyl transferase superfamily protein [Puia sp.]|nr:4'-phosphopantetheinyl transferase superfamily protein [Puia sp.]
MSTGNDIVALALTDADRTGQYRFYSRVLSPVELRHQGVTGLPLPFFVWLCWSVKESVYKYASRSDRRLVFAPLKIPIDRLFRHDGYYKGVVSYGGAVLYSRSFLSDETILTVVSEEENFMHTRWGLHSIDSSDYPIQSATARIFALQSLSAVFPGAALRIVKAPDGPPELWDGDRLLDIPVSLAHHDRYVAWSYRLPSKSST